MSTKYKGEVVMSKNIKESVIKNFLSSLLSVENKISLNDFIDRIPQAFNLSDYDEENSSTRPTEPMFEQRVRNLISHNNLPDDVDYEDGFFKKK